MEEPIRLMTPPKELSLVCASSGFAWRRLLVPVTCSSEVMGPSLTTCCK